MYRWNLNVDRYENLLAAAEIAQRTHNDSESHGPMGELETSAGRMQPVQRYFHEPRVRPNYQHWRINDNHVVSIAGIGGANDALAVYDGYRVPVEMPPLGGKYNAMAKQWYDFVRGAFLERFTGGRGNVIFIGHSWGATTAWLLANLAKGMNGGNYVGVITFGQPRFCTRHFWENCRVDEWVRVMNPGDIVPHIIPNLTEDPFFNALHFPPQIEAFNTAVSCVPGTVLGEAGLIRRDSNMGLTFPLSLGIESLKRHIVEQGGPHGINAYVGALQRLHNLNVLPARELPPAPAVQVPEPAPRMTLAQANELIQQQRLERIENNVPFVPVQPDPFQESLKIKVKRDGRVWQVLIGETLAYMTDNKSDARAVARASLLLSVM